MTALHHSSRPFVRIAIGAVALVGLAVAYELAQVAACVAANRRENGRG